MLREIVARDEHDSSRAAAPLTVAEGASVIDTSELTLAESIEAVCTVISEKLGVRP